MTLDKDLAKTIQDLMPECKEAVAVRFPKIKTSGDTIKSCLMVDFVIDFLHKLIEEKHLINGYTTQDWKDYAFHEYIRQENYIIYICGFGITNTIYMLQNFGVKAHEINHIENVINFLSLAIMDEILFEYQKINKISDDDWYDGKYRVIKFKEYLVKEYSKII